MNSFGVANAPDDVANRHGCGNAVELSPRRAAAARHQAQHHAARGDPGRFTRLHVGVSVTDGHHGVSRSLSAAMTSTIASKRRRVVPENVRLPSPEPINPPMSAAPAQIGSALGKNRTLTILPVNAAAELARMNAVDSPAMRWGSAHPSRSTRGLSRTPPPVPVSPASSPITEPEAIAGKTGGAMFPQSGR